MESGANPALYRPRLLARARELARHGLSAEQVMAQLEQEVPGLRYLDGPAWRRDVEYANPAAIACMERTRGRLPGHQPAPPRPLFPRAQDTPAPMGQAVAALAALNNHTCIYCGRTGGAEADPDGQPWQRDLVPATFRDVTPAAGSFVLSCAACKAKPGRFTELAGVEI